MLIAAIIFINLHTNNCLVLADVTSYPYTSYINSTYMKHITNPNIVGTLDPQTKATCMSCVHTYRDPLIHRIVE